MISTKSTKSFNYTITESQRISFTFVTSKNNETECCQKLDCKFYVPKFKKHFAQTQTILVNTVGKHMDARYGWGRKA